LKIFKAICSCQLCNFIDTFYRNIGELPTKVTAYIRVHARRGVPQKELRKQTILTSLTGLSASWLLLSVTSAVDSE